MQPEQMQLTREFAIDLAIISGDVLHGLGDARHYWALTLIISNLFELVGEGDSGAYRFVDGYVKIVGQRHDYEVALGWHAGCIARAIRNLTAHGLELERAQIKNYATRERVTIHSMGFLEPLEDEDGLFMYNVNRFDGNTYSLSFAPSVFWRLVQNWYSKRDE